MYDQAMPPDATDTKRRLMQAAVDEFARHGLAGARVDRIADNAKANKRSIYMHFGTKEELFDLVVADSMLTLAESITFTGDLPRYAGDLYDRVQKWPHIRRLYYWANLEREQGVNDETFQYRQRLTAIRTAQQSGHVRDDIPAAELLAMVIAIVLSWDTSAWSLQALRPEFGGRTPGSRRASVVTSVAALAQPQPART
jgi:AcrR family transcriptional regulator